MGDEGTRYSFRKRKRLNDGYEESVNQLLELVASCGRVVIFSGSGLSANSGMSMFSTKNGLYERARQRFKIQDGIKLFSYPFYKQRRKDVQQFFAQIYGEAKNSKAAPGHVAIAQLHELGKLQRHYTLNIDGLAEVVGMDTWHHEKNPNGITVEMHGNISYVVCPSCHAVEPLNGSVMQTMKACQPVICRACQKDEMRFKVMLYDDEEGDCITPEDVFERLEDDLEVAGAVVWVGISFEQSASTEYFRKVRHMLAGHGRLEDVVQVIINPSEEAYFNVLSTVSKKEDVKVLDVRGTSDDVLPCVVRHLHQTLGTQPDPASAMAAAEAAAAAALARQKAQALRKAAEAAEAAAAAANPPSRRGRRPSSSSDGGMKAQLQQEPTTMLEVDSAAAAALALPAAVQQHLQKLQQAKQEQSQPSEQQVLPDAVQQQGETQQQQLPGVPGNMAGLSPALLHGPLIMVPSQLVSAVKGSTSQSSPTESAPVVVSSFSAAAGAGSLQAVLAQHLAAEGNSPLATSAAAAGTAVGCGSPLLKAGTSAGGAAGANGVGHLDSGVPSAKGADATGGASTSLAGTVQGSGANLQALLQAHMQGQGRQQQQQHIENGVAEVKPPAGSAGVAALTAQQQQQQSGHSSPLDGAVVGATQAVLQAEQQQTAAVVATSSPFTGTAPAAAPAAFGSGVQAALQALQHQALQQQQRQQQLGLSVSQAGSPLMAATMQIGAGAGALQTALQAMQQQQQQQQQSGTAVSAPVNFTAIGAAGAGSLQSVLQLLQQQQQQIRATNSSVAASGAAGAGPWQSVLLQEQQVGTTAGASATTSAAGSVLSALQALQQQQQAGVLTSTPLTAGVQSTLVSAPLQSLLQALQQPQASLPANSLHAGTAKGQSAAGAAPGLL